MNTFALLLLAWPFYLIVNKKLAANNRLTDYINLAKSSQATANQPASDSEVNDYIKTLPPINSGSGKMGGTL